MSCRPLDVESFRNRARLPKGITRRKRGGYDESKKVSRTLLTGGSDRGPEASVAHPAEETKSVGTNRDSCAAWRLFHSGSLSFPRDAPAPCRTVGTDCPQSSAHHRR